LCRFSRRDRQCLVEFLVSHVFFFLVAATRWLTVPRIVATAALVKDYVEHAEHKALRSEIPIIPPTNSPVDHHAEMNPFKGFMAVTAACMTSGLAGVYFEMVLKGSKADLWTRNIQLSFFSLIPALLPVLFNGSSGAGTGLVGTLIEPFRNFSLWAWATVLTQVFGGLITALVIKYSDNILKGFATSLSIILSFLASVGLFNYPITPAFVIGSMVVLCATWMYNQPEQKKANAMAVGGPTPSRMDVAVSGSPIRQDAPIIGETPKPSRTPSVASLIGLANSITRSSTPTAQHGDHLQPSSMPYASNNSNSNSNRGTPTGYYTPIMSSYPSSVSLSSITSSPILQQEFSVNGGQHVFTIPSRHGQGQHTPPSSTYRPPIHVNIVNSSNAVGGHYSQPPVFEHEESIPTSPYTATTSYSSGPRVMRDSPVRERKGSVARGQRPVMDLHPYDKMR
jgi:UDP-sugar transporter A1/2/3